MSATPLSMKEAALAALNLGLHVFPLAAKSKVPMRGSAGHKDASCYESSVEAWWSEMPAANIGIACGASGIIVLDFDEGEPPSDLPKTYTVRTKRGLLGQYARHEVVQRSQREGWRLEELGRLCVKRGQYPPRWTGVHRC